MEEMNLTDEIIKALEFKAKYDCERTYLGCCSDGKPFEEDEEEGE